MNAVPRWVGSVFLSVALILVVIIPIALAFQLTWEHSAVWTQGEVVGFKAITGDKYPFHSIVRFYSTDGLPYTIVSSGSATYRNHLIGQPIAVAYHVGRAESARLENFMSRWGLYVALSGMACGFFAFGLGARKFQGQKSGHSDQEVTRTISHGPMSTATVTSLTQIKGGVSWTDPRTIVALGAGLFFLVGSIFALVGLWAMLAVPRPPGGPCFLPLGLGGVAISFYLAANIVTGKLVPDSKGIRIEDGDYLPSAILLVSGVLLLWLSISFWMKGEVHGISALIAVAPGVTLLGQGASSARKRHANAKIG